jgi:hypothetical protein
MALVSGRHKPRRKSVVADVKTESSDGRSLAVLVGRGLALLATAVMVALTLLWIGALRG